MTVQKLVSRFNSLTDSHNLGFQTFVVVKMSSMVCVTLQNFALPCDVSGGNGKKLPCIGHYTKYQTSSYTHIAHTIDASCMVASTCLRDHQRSPSASPCQLLTIRGNGAL